MVTQKEQKEWAQREMTYAEKSIREQTANIIKRMREKADDIERNLNRDPATYETSRLVEDTIHEITWMVPNLNLDTLVRNGASFAASKEKLKIITAME